ncbi:hypothetical protein OK023_01540 [Serratia sp. UGAL515B_01]|nr:hypothetical protein OK023_01540 [Serratia sp. UGAL515B_01]
MSADNAPELAEIGINTPSLNYVNERFLSSPAARNNKFNELKAREETLKQQGVLS